MTTIRPASPGFFILTAVLAVCLSGCATENSSVEKPVSPFYDVQGFFEKEVDRLQVSRARVDKKVTFEGVEEEHRIDTLDFERELKVFLDSDINRAAWWDRYSIDSTMEGKALRSIRYEALDQDLKIKTLLLTFSQDTLQTVDIHLASKSPATVFSQDLYYDAREGYRIRTSQNVKLSAQKEFLVEARFLE